MKDLTTISGRLSKHVAIIFSCQHQTNSDKKVCKYKTDIVYKIIYNFYPIITQYTSSPEGPKESNGSKHSKNPKRQ